MSDAWRPGLSQNIEEDEEIDDDHAVPPTPGQEDIDAASPTQDNASALSCLASTSTSSKRPLMFLGEPINTLDFEQTADDELMPYLAADVSETSSKVGLIEDCPGDDLESGFEKALSNAAAAAVGVNTTQWGTPPTSPLGPCATSSENTAGVTLKFTKTSLSSSYEYGHIEFEKKEQTLKGFATCLKRQDSSSSSSILPYSESSSAMSSIPLPSSSDIETFTVHPYSSKPSNTLESSIYHEGYKSQTKDKSNLDPENSYNYLPQDTSFVQSACMKESPIIPCQLMSLYSQDNPRASSGHLESPAVLSQLDNMSNRYHCNTRTAISSNLLGDNLCTETSIVNGKNIGSQSQNFSDLLLDEEEDIIPPSPPTRDIQAAPSLGSTLSIKRKNEDRSELYSCSPSKQSKMDNSNSSSVSTDSTEEKVIVNYSKLTKKDVEISPKRQVITPHTKPAFPTNTSQRITFSSEDSSDKDKKNAPNRLPYDTELDDSDCEILEDENKSIEVVFEKPKMPPKNSKSRSSLEVGDSQEFSLRLTGLTQSENSQMSQIIDTEGGQRLSQALLPYGLTEEPDTIESQEQSQSQSQSLLPMPESIPLSCHDTLFSSSEENTQSQGVGSMQVTQIEAICQPADFTQPADIDTLLSFPIQKKDNGVARKSKENIDKQKIQISNGKESEERTKKKELLRKNSEVIVSEGFQPSKLVEDTPRLMLPEILTPSTQEIPNTLESFGSESVFQKVSKAVEKKLLTEKNNEQSKISFESSCEKVSYLEDQQRGTSNDLSLIEISSAGSSAVTSPVKMSQSSHSTPISSQAERLLHTSILFGSGKKDTSLADKSQQILVEESGSDEEGLKNKSKSKKKISKVKEKLKNEQLEKVRKSSTPNTSHGISPNISDESAHSYIQKDVSSEPETSKSHNSSVENLSTENSTADADTELLADVSEFGYEEELLSQGYYKVKLNESIMIKHQFIRESDKSIIYYFEHEGSEHMFLQSNLKSRDISRSGSGSSSSKGRVSDVSSISRNSGYSGYLGDKSSSSSDASRRISTFSNNSARLSISSLPTISPPRPYDQDTTGTFAVPQARALTGRIHKSPITEEITLHDSPKNNSKQQILVIESKKASPIAVDKIGRGRAKESRAGRGRKTKGRPKGKGRGAILQDKDYDSTDSQDIASLPKTPIKKKSPTKRNIKDKTKSPRKVKKSNENISLVASPGSHVSNLEELEDILERCYSEMPLSEEEELAFMHEGKKDDETQLDIIQNRVRHTNLEISMLVFARFTDNNYYSARLLKEDKDHNRWDVEYTLDRHSHSVRDVHILPTVLLPRGQVCAVRPDNQLDSMNDTGIVTGHLRQGNNLKHIIATNRGVTLHSSHSHLVLTEGQIKRLLEARHKYRSMVASPGSDVNFDNICPGKRRRAPLKPFSSPRSKKNDPNVDTSDATAGESEDLLASNRKSPVKPKARGRGNKRKNLFTVTEESESEDEVMPGPSTSRGRGRGQLPSSPRTPQKSSHKVKATPEVISDIRKISDSPLPNRISEIQHEELPQKSPSPKKRGRSQSGSMKLKTEESKKLPVPLNSSLGPLPKKDSNIFAGFTVLITNGDSSLRNQEDVDDDLPKLNKNHLTDQICQGGGSVVETFSELEILLADKLKSQEKNTPAKSRKASKQKEENKLLLISNTFCRTVKYISCLAAGVPCVDFRWIIHCSTQNKIIEWQNYLLLAGETDDGEFEQKLNLENHVPSKALLGTHVFLASSTNKSFKSLWHPILVTAHAEVKEKPQNARGNNADQLNRVLDRSVSVVLADSSIPDAQAIRARQLNIPIVSTMWLIESIISGQCLDYSHIEKFSHNYIPSKPETVQDEL